ncbi:MAG: hypothetical protein HRT35_22310, partial [Algicola sp.]|nr:hypothetical protein [Algicola sp.]
MTSVQIEQVLEAILASRYFSRAGRAGAFLRFVVKQKLNSQLDQLTSYSIGLVVFGRDEGFNPHADNIVRVNAGRLRHKLAEYYRSPQGQAQRLRISLPERSYQPLFLLDEQVVDVGSVEQAATDVAVQKNKQAQTAKPYPLRREKWALSAAAVLMLGLVFFINITKENLSKTEPNRQTLNSPGLKDKLLGDRYFDAAAFTPALEHYRQAVLKA